MGFRRVLEIAGALLRLIAFNLDLLYWMLPRGIRGGYRSPWLAKKAGV